MPSPAQLSDLAPFTSHDGEVVTAGCFGVSHGAGMTGALIRHATNSWAGHAFVYIGNGQMVQGVPPVADIVPAYIYPESVWNSREVISENARMAIIARAYALVGTPYDWPAYVGFGLELLHLRSGTQLDSVFRQDQWRVCSALVADCYAHAGILVEVNGQDPNLVSPADLYKRIESQNPAVTRPGG